MRIWRRVDTLCAERMHRPCRRHKPQGGGPRTQKRGGCGGLCGDRRDRCVLRSGGSLRHDRLQPAVPARGRGGAARQGLVWRTGRHGPPARTSQGVHRPSPPRRTHRHRRVVSDGRPRAGDGPGGLECDRHRGAEAVLREALGPRAQAPIQADRRSGASSLG